MAPIESILFVAHRLGTLRNCRAFHACDDVAFPPQIQKDVPRTMGANPGAHVAPSAVERVLMAFAAREPTPGYQQGMNFIVAALIACTSNADEADGGAAAERAAFWVLCATKTLFKDFFCETLSGAIAETEAIVRCVVLCFCFVPVVAVVAVVRVCASASACARACA